MKISVIFTLIVAIYSTMHSQVRVTEGTNLVAKTGTDIVIGGNFQNYGAVTSSSGSRLVFIGGIDQYISGSSAGNTFADVTINKNSGNLLLQSDITINGELALNAGSIYPLSNDLNLGSNASVSGSPDNTRMIAISGTGKVKKYFSSLSSFTFPVGSANTTPKYSPVAITLSGGSLSGAWISAQVTDSKHANNTSSADFINRYWTLNSGGITNPVYNAAFYYSSVDINGSESNLHGGMWQGGQWNYLGAVNSSLHSFSSSALTAFGDFTAGEEMVMGAYGVYNLTFLPEGFYNQALNRLNIKDTFSVYLASISSPYSFIDTAKVILDSITFSAQALFRRASSGSYFVVIRHRNALETWSKAGGEAFLKGQTQSFDFSSALNMAYNSNMKQVGTKWCLYSGDVNQDGLIDYTDTRLIDATLQIYGTGYLIEDITGDGIVDLSDIIIVDNNSTAAITRQRP